jgi:hypothetical protein
LINVNQIAVRIFEVDGEHTWQNYKAERFGRFVVERQLDLGVPTSAFSSLQSLSSRADSGHV